jgi:putative hydrolase
MTTFMAEPMQPARDLLGRSSPYDAPMSDSGPLGDDPFEAIPLLAELMQLLSSQRPGWDSAKQVAASLATGGHGEPNVDPSVRIAFEELGRVAELHVAQTTGLDVSGHTGRPPIVLATTRATWAERTLDAYRPLLEAVTTSIGSTDSLSTMVDDDDDPMAAWLQQFLTAMAPAMATMSAGSMVGHLAARAFGSFDLPIPRATTGLDELLVCPHNIDAFGTDWSLPLDELRLWVCVHEMVFHAALAVPFVADPLRDLLRAHAAAFRPDPTAIEAQLGDLDLDLSSGDLSSLARLQDVLKPEMIFGAMQSSEQRALLPRLETIVAALVGYVDHTMDIIGHRLMPSYDRITEALRRRRVEATEADRFVERLLGLNLTQAQVQRGHDFAAGVVERAGADGLGRLFERADSLPTPSELAAPGLWLARIDL